MRRRRHRRLAVSSFEKGPCRRQGIEVWRLDAGVAVAAEVVRPQGINSDKDDVRSGLSGSYCSRNQSCGREYGYLGVAHA